MSKGKKAEFDVNKSYTFKLYNGNGALSLGTECLTFDESDAQKTVKLRYLPRFNTPFEDEQPVLSAEELTLLPKESISFTRGELIVSGVKNALLLYLTNHDSFGGKKNRMSRKEPLFYLEDYEALLNAKEAKIDQEAVALESVKSCDKQQLREIAVGFFGLPVDASDKEVKVAMLEKAKEKPSHVLKAIQSPKPKRLFDIKSGFDKGILVDVKGEIQWAKTGAVITTVPKKEDKVEFLADYIIKEGKDFYELLKKELM